MRQLTKSAGAIVAFCVLAAGFSSVAAHHSTTMFDHSKTVTIKGTVVELRWVNPHVTLTINGPILNNGTIHASESGGNWNLGTLAGNNGTIQASNGGSLNIGGAV